MNLVLRAVSQYTSVVMFMCIIIIMQLQSMCHKYVILRSHVNVFPALLVCTVLYITFDDSATQWFDFCVYVFILADLRSGSRIASSHQIGTKYFSELVN